MESRKPMKKLANNCAHCDKPSPYKFCDLACRTLYTIIQEMHGNSVKNGLIEDWIFSFDEEGQVVKKVIFRKTDRFWDS